jgi:hypothetical protein
VDLCGGNGDFGEKDVIARLVVRIGVIKRDDALVDVEDVPGGKMRGVAVLD